MGAPYVFNPQHCTVRIDGLPLIAFAIGDTLIIEPYPPRGRFERLWDRRQRFRQARRAFMCRMRQRRSWGFPV